MEVVLTGKSWTELGGLCDCCVCTLGLCENPWSWVGMGWSNLGLQYHHLHSSWYPQISHPHGANKLCLRHHAPKQALEQVLNHYLILHFFHLCHFFGEKPEMHRFSSSMVTCQPRLIQNYVLINIILYFRKKKKKHLCVYHLFLPFFSYFHIRFLSYATYHIYHFLSIFLFSSPLHAKIHPIFSFLLFSSSPKLYDFPF